MFLPFFSNQTPTSTRSFRQHQILSRKNLQHFNATEPYFLRPWNNAYRKWFLLEEIIRDLPIECICVVSTIMQTEPVCRKVGSQIKVKHWYFQFFHQISLLFVKEPVPRVAHVSNPIGKIFGVRIFWDYTEETPDPGPDLMEWHPGWNLLPWVQSRTSDRREIGHKHRVVKNGSNEQGNRFLLVFHKATHSVINFDPEVVMFKCSLDLKLSFFLSRLVEAFAKGATSNRSIVWKVARWVISNIWLRNFLIPNQVPSDWISV